MAAPWNDDPLSWDTLKVAGQAFPGLAKVKATRKYKLDQKNTGGADGATLTGLGHMPAEVKVSVRIWEDAHWDALADAIALLIPKPHKGRPAPVDVYHPALKVLGIKSLYFTGVSAPEEAGMPQLYQLELEAVEFLPVKTDGALSAANTPHKSVHVEVPVAPGTLPTGAPPPDENPADTGP